MIYLYVVPSWAPFVLYKDTGGKHGWNQNYTYNIENLLYATEHGIYEVHNSQFFKELFTTTLQAKYYTQTTFVDLFS